MSSKRYPEEFKIEAVKQVVDRGHSVSSVATRFDIYHSLYAWIRNTGRTLPQQRAVRCSGRDPPTPEGAEAGYRRTGHIKKNRGVLRKAVRLRYAFIRDNSCCWPVRLLCRVLNVHRVGFTPGFSSRIHNGFRRI
jgi:putative transposase